MDAIYGYDNPVKVHVTGVFKPGEAVQLYVNGQLAAEDVTNVPANIGLSGKFKIGARADNTTQGHWDGQIDDLRITGRALSASEIQSLSGRPVTAVTRVHQIEEGTDSLNLRHLRLSAFICVPPKPALLCGKGRMYVNNECFFIRP